MSAVKEERLTSVLVAVDYSLSLNAMINGGGYDSVHTDITSRNFRLSTRGYQRHEILLVQFHKPVAPLEVVARMKERNYRSAMIEELLALGSQHPDLQRSIPIVALGSARVTKNRRYVPCLGGSQSARTLGLVVIYRRWSIYYRFALVKE